MLVLSRKVGESIRIGQHIHVTLLAIHGNQVRLGVTAPDDVRIMREELLRESSPTPRSDSCVVVS